MCLECLENIIKALGLKIKEQELDRDRYMKELLRVEEAIGGASQEDEAKIAAELRLLEAEEAELDKQLARLEEEDRANTNEL